MFMDHYTLYYLINPSEKKPNNSAFLKTLNFYFKTSNLKNISISFCIYKKNYKMMKMMLNLNSKNNNKITIKMNIMEINIKSKEINIYN